MKAIALISGGLDSILAARLIKEQGITIFPLNFYLPFYNLQKDNSSKTIASFVRRTLGQDLNTVDISRQFLKILENPKYGYGSNMNPCIDCKILMLSEAKELLKELGAEFIVTGEVVGQRPMSQHKQALELIERRSGLKGILLRPLSAKHLPQTLPEKEGWVDRNKLLSFSGRTRKPQIELAKAFKIEDYPNPAGGCLLTDLEFAKRLKDILGRNELNLANIELLKIGRHFRIKEDVRLVVGRNEKENKRLENLAKENDYLFLPQSTAGPIALGMGIFDDDLIKLSCAIVSRYCDRNGKAAIAIVYKRILERQEKILEALPMEETKIQELRI
jgi:tRNA U34 2-thiouridine synthase MnmA/TrmU